MCAAIKRVQAFGSGNGKKCAAVVGANQREESFRQRIVYFLPRFAGVEGSEQSTLLQGREASIARSGCILKLQVADVGTAPIASRVVRAVEPHVRSDQQILVIHTAKVKISGGRKGKFFGVPVRAGSGRIQQIFRRNGPNLGAVQRNVQRLRGHLHQRIVGCRFPSRAFVGGNKDAAGGGREPRVSAEGQFVHLKCQLLRRCFLS